MGQYQQLELISFEIRKDAADWILDSQRLANQGLVCIMEQGMKSSERFLKDVLP